jgi:predicted esterase
VTDTPTEPEIAPDPATEWYAPNQQSVRPDGSGPAEEGDGGSSWEDPQPKDTDTGVDLDVMSKDELLAYAQKLGVSPANASMTKADLVAGIEAKQAGG